MVSEPFALEGPKVSLCPSIMNKEKTALAQRCPVPPDPHIEGRGFSFQGFSMKTGLNFREEVLLSKIFCRLVFSSHCHPRVLLHTGGPWLLPFTLGQAIFKAFVKIE